MAGACLRGANLANTILVGADLSSASLESAYMGGCKLWNEAFFGRCEVKLMGANFFGVSGLNENQKEFVKHKGVENIQFVDIADVYVDPATVVEVGQTQGLNIVPNNFQEAITQQ